MQILVTGAAGRIGSQVALELAAHGHTVRALDRRPLSPEVRHAAQAIYADITDPLAMLNALSGCDTVAHVAALAGPFGPAEEVLRINVLGTQNILEAAMAHELPRVIVTSSVGALGFSFPKHPCLPDYLPVDVLHPRRPQDIYGLSKLMNEESAAAATRLSGITTIVLRPPAVWDLERAKKHGWLQRSLERRGEERDSSLWGYIDVHDQAVAYRLALESDLTGHHVFYTMADDLGVNASARDLAERHLPSLEPQVERLTGNSFYDLTPASELLGFVPERTWRQVLDGPDDPLS